MDGSINQIDFNEIIFANLYTEMIKVNTMIDDLDNSLKRFKFSDFYYFSIIIVFYTIL